MCVKNYTFSGSLHPVFAILSIVFFFHFRGGNQTLNVLKLLNVNRAKVSSAPVLRLLLPLRPGPPPEHLGKGLAEQRRSSICGGGRCVVSSERGESLGDLWTHFQIIESTLLCHDRFPKQVFLCPFCAAFTVPNLAPQ